MKTTTQNKPATATTATATTATAKNQWVIIETINVTRDYGFRGTAAIIDTPDGRILIEDGFGGIDTIYGGCVRWCHGAAYSLQPEDTFASLDIEGCGGVWPLYALRPLLNWRGQEIEKIAKSLKL